MSTLAASKTSPKIAAASLTVRKRAPLVVKRLSVEGRGRTYFRAEFENAPDFVICLDAGDPRKTFGKVDAFMIALLGLDAAMPRRELVDAYSPYWADRTKARGMTVSQAAVA